MSESYASSREMAAASSDYLEAAGQTQNIDGMAAIKANRRAAVMADEAYDAADAPRAREGERWRLWLKISRWADCGQPRRSRTARSFGLQ